MPMMYPPPAPQRPPGGGFVRMVFMTLASVIFSLSLMLNMYFIAAAVLSHRGDGQRVAVKSGSSHEKIGVITVESVITSDLARQAMEFVEQAEDDPNIRALVIEVDTPGGEVTASDQINQRLRRFKEARPGVPVVVTMGAMATSGGYYISCGADRIFAQPTTITGHVGAIWMNLNVSQLVQRWGITESTITAPAQGFKNAGSMFQPVKPEETAYLQGLVDEAFNQFKAAVVHGRVDKDGKTRLTQPIEQIACGKAYTARQAMELGLIDQVGYWQDAVDWVTKEARLTNPSIVQYEKRKGLLQLMLEGPGSSDGQFTLKLDRNLLADLDRPRLMYLWR
jgi:protease-4